MADKRMFSLKIVDSDLFLDMPLSSQCLYFHLSMRADDDGFVDNPKKIIKIIGANDDDLKILITKGFVIVFERGIIVITHWKINNYIRSDRRKETMYITEKQSLTQTENGAYIKLEQLGIPNDNLSCQYICYTYEKVFQNTCYFIENYKWISQGVKLCVP